MPQRRPGASVKDDHLYETLRREGNSNEKAARIANAAAAQSRSTVGRRGGQSAAYEAWTVEELLDRSRELELAGPSGMSTAELIDAPRHH